METGGVGFSKSVGRINRSFANAKSVSGDDRITCDEGFAGSKDISGSESFTDEEARDRCVACDYQDALICKWDVGPQEAKGALLSCPFSHSVCRERIPLALACRRLRLWLRPDPGNVFTARRAFS